MANFGDFFRLFVIVSVSFCKINAYVRLEEFSSLIPTTSTNTVWDKKPEYKYEEDDLTHGNPFVTYPILKEHIKKIVEEVIHDAKKHVKPLWFDDTDVARNEVDNTNKQKNEHLTVQWFSNTVSEIRMEISELAKSYNSSVVLQQRQNLVTDISILQNDVVSLRHDIEMLKAELTKVRAKQSTVDQELEIVRYLSHQTSAATANLTEELRVVTSDWSRTMKYSRKKSKDNVFKRVVFGEEDVSKSNVITYSEQDSGKSRHFHHFVKQLNIVKETVKKLKVSQLHLKRQMGTLGRQLRSELDSTRTSSTNDGQLLNRVEILEKLTWNSNNVLENITTQLAGQEKIRGSVLELLEDIENLENKVDTTIPDLRREISKLEISCAQSTSLTAFLKENVENERISLKAMGESMTMLHTKVAERENEIEDLKRVIEDVKKLRSKFIIDEKNYREKKKITTEAKNRSQKYSKDIMDTYQNLSTIYTEYQHMVHELPKGCEDMKGTTSGLHLISPDGNSPILVPCQLFGNVSYTVFQRRFNGEQDFSKNWDQYAQGFGSPDDEFWLGNEALHRLTKNNDTGIRVDFKDITGKAWYAVYKEFSVGPKSDGYRLHVAEYSGNASDALEYQNRMKFSTVDTDYDISNTNCAKNYEGGWWFSHCQHANLNGRYNLGLTWFDGIHNEWITVSSSELKLFKSSIYKNIID